MQYASYAIWCLLLITGIAIYFPIIVIRKADRLQKILERIEANTARKP